MRGLAYLRLRSSCLVGLDRGFDEHRFHLIVRTVLIGLVRGCIDQCFRLLGCLPMLSARHSLRDLDTHCIMTESHRRTWRI